MVSFFQISPLTRPCMHLSCAPYMPTTRNFILYFSNEWKEIKTYEEKESLGAGRGLDLHHEWKMKSSFWMPNRLEAWRLLQL